MISIFHAVLGSQNCYRNLVRALFKVSTLAIVLWCSSSIAEPSNTHTTGKIQGVAFHSRKISIKGKTLTVEIADTEVRQQQGLMFRNELLEGHGMLFIFPAERPLSFWMKNTLIPLNIGYFDKQKKLIETHEMVPAVMGAAEIPNYPSKAPAMYALEVPKGWFAKHQIKSGDKFEFVDRARK